MHKVNGFCSFSCWIADVVKEMIIAELALPATKTFTGDSFNVDISLKMYKNIHNMLLSVDGCIIAYKLKDTFVFTVLTSCI